AVLTFLIFAVSYYGEVVGNFTFRVDKRDYEAGLSLVKDPETQQYTSVLYAEKVESADAMTAFCGTEYTAFPEGHQFCLPSDEELTSVNGSNNGESYLAYTFYLANAGGRVVDLKATVNLISTTRGAEESLRVRIIVDDVGTTYAKVQTERGEFPGEPEIGTVPFSGQYEVMNKQFSAFETGNLAKISIVVWYEGEDADHNNNIIGGGVKLEMEFSITYVYDDDEEIQN
ncbi:MAG: hypothetical protein JXB20_05080, partial [Bacilli bacterium]|nr:hypothetical protein [Bacilli bacterium]